MGFVEMRRGTRVEARDGRKGRVVSHSKANTTWVLPEWSGGTVEIEHDTGGHSYWMPSSLREVK